MFENQIKISRNEFDILFDILSNNGIANYYDENKDMIIICYMGNHIATYNKDTNILYYDKLL